MLTDIRYAIRALRGAPAFTLVAVSTLALGIAVNTIAFTLLNSLALRPMPVRDASRIVRIYPVDETGRRHNLFSYPDYQSYRDQQQSFEALVAYIPSEDHAGRRGAGCRTAGGPRLCGVGQSLPDARDRAVARPRRSPRTRSGAPPPGRVAVISFSIWQRRYAGAADVVGRTSS